MAKAATRVKTIIFPVDIVEVIEAMSEKQRRTFSGSVLKIIDDFIANNKNLENRKSIG